MAEYISYIYRIIDNFSPALKKIDAATRNFGNSMKKAQAGARAMGQKLNSMQTFAASAATTIGGKVAMDKYVEFARSMNKLESVTFATRDQMARMRDMAKELGATTSFTAGQAAEGMTYLAMAGLDTEQVLKAIPGALQLAAAGSIDLGQAADIATNVLGQMGMKVEDLTHVNDVLALAQSKANFNITELFEAMRPVGTTAKNLGVSLEELTAYLGAMANAGEKGSIAGTLLRNAMTEVSTASDTQRKIYKALGINLSEFMDKSGKLTNFKGLVGKLGELNKAGKMSVGVLQALYGERGFRAMQILAGAGAEGIAEFENKLKDSAGAAEKAANIQMKGLPGVLTAMASAFEAVNIAIFESGIDKILIDIASGMTSIARSLSQTNPGLLKAAGIMTLLATVAGPLLITLGVISTAIGAISLPIAVMVAAFAGVGAAIYQISKNWDYLVMDFNAGVDAILKFFDNMKKGFLDTVDDIHKAFSFMGNNIANIFEKLLTRLEPFRVFLSDIGGFIKDFSGTVGGKARDFFGLGEKGVAAQNATVTKQALNGEIVVAPAKGAQVKSARLSTDVPGNLGFNIAGGGW